VAIAAALLTLLVNFAAKSTKNLLMTFLQNFCGALFLFSGYVKAIDPLGTAFKMEQYFAEFFYTFKDTALSFMAPVFPWFSEHSIVFSIAMIVFEIALGVMLLVGFRPKLTAWLFLLLVILFTILTGFTYLTGYVPSGVNFFDYGQWGKYVETKMRVTDCGCFGDFIKLKPKQSFFKDVFLLLPSLYFVFKHGDMHQLFSARTRSILVWLTTFALIAFCYWYTYMDEPLQDFRPFQAGMDIRGQKAKESEALANVKITHYQMTNKTTGQVVMIPYEQYLKEFKNYPKEEWDFEQIKTEPAIQPSKISDFDISDADGNNVTEDILTDPNYALMVVSYKIKQMQGKQMKTATVTDTTFVVDTVKVAGTDSIQLVKKVDKITPRQVEIEVAAFDPDFEQRFTGVINPVMEAAEKAGIKVFAVTAPNDPAVVEDFRHSTQSAYPFYTADDLLLKTIMRSNPGLVLWKDGKIIQKWHYKKMPSYDEIKAKYIQ
jgi:uncharacterized membrane protein YphA (DoxX/SURF4 family)